MDTVHTYLLTAAAWKMWNDVIVSDLASHSEPSKRRQQYMREDRDSKRIETEILKNDHTLLNLAQAATKCSAKKSVSHKDYRLML